MPKDIVPVTVVTRVMLDRLHLQRRTPLVLATQSVKALQARDCLYRHLKMMICSYIIIKMKLGLLLISWVQYDLYRTMTYRHEREVRTFKFQ